MTLFWWLLSVLEWSKSSYSISKYYFGSIFFLLWFQNSNYIGVLSPHCFLCISYCIICISIIFFSPSFILNIFCLICFQFIKPLFNTCQSTVLFFDCLFTELLNLYYLVLGFLLTTHTNTHKHVSYTVIINIIFYLLEHNKQWFKSLWLLQCLGSWWSFSIIIYYFIYCLYWFSFILYIFECLPVFILLSLHS